MLGTLGTAPGAGATLPLGRWLLIAVLLTAEYAGAVHWLDTENLPERFTALSALAYAHLVPQLAVLVATAVLLLAGAQLRHSLTSLAAELSAPRPLGALLGGQLASYAALLWLGGLLFRADAALRGPPALWAALWVALALAVAAFTTAAALPLRPLLHSLARLWMPLLLSLGTALLAWGAALASGELWHSLSRVTLYGVAWLVALFSASPVLVPEQQLVGTADFVVEVDVPCSGYQGIGLILVFLAGYLLACRKQLRFPHALALLPLAVAAIFAANIARIAALIGVGVYVSPEVAVSGFHSKAGWLLFCAVALCVVFLTRDSRFFTRAATPAAAAAGPVTAPAFGPTGAYLLPELWVVGSALVTGLFTLGFNTLYGVSAIAGSLALLAYRHQLPRASWPPSWEPIAIGTAVFALWIAVQPAPDAEYLDTWLGELFSLPPVLLIGWLLLRTLGSVVVVPIVEELAFRGYLMRRLIALDFTAVSYRQLSWVSVAVSSLAFGALHQRWAVGTLAGACFALAAYRRGRLSDAVIAHAVANGLIAVCAVFGGRWELWA